MKILSTSFTCFTQTAAVQRNKLFIPVLVLLLLVIVITAIALGSVSILPSDMLSAVIHFFQGKKAANIYEGVFLQLRLPRVLLCAITGAVLSVSGVLMQGLFRNPIVEPGLVGTSSGAALGASIVFVLASGFSPALKSFTGPLLMPLAAFAGALTATYAVYSLARNAKRISILSLLLIGIAVNAVCLSGTGFMS